MGSTVAVGSELQAYRAEPQGEVRGGLVLVHEIWGLVPHIEHLADRFAAAGYLTLAPDLLSRVGLDRAMGEQLFADYTSPDEAVRSAAQPRMREVMAPAQAPEFAGWATARLRECVDALAADDRVGGRIAVVGFCFGGTYAFALAAADDRVRAAVPFYGVAPADIDRISGAVLAVYGETDERVTSGAPQVERTLRDAGVDVTVQVYPAVGHAFFNDTNRQTYDADAAADAWQRVLRFLDEQLPPSGS